jgi:hypothetical protein
MGLKIIRGWHMNFESTHTQRILSASSLESPADQETIVVNHLLIGAISPHDVEKMFETDRPGVDYQLPIERHFDTQILIKDARNAPIHVGRVIFSHGNRGIGPAPVAPIRSGTDTEAPSQKSDLFFGVTGTPSTIAFRRFGTACLQKGRSRSRSFLLLAQNQPLTSLSSGPTMPPLIQPDRLEQRPSTMMVHAPATEVANHVGWMPGGWSLSLQLGHDPQPCSKGKFE